MKSEVAPYYSFRNEISYEDEKIRKNRRPTSSTRGDLTQHLHSSHMGIEGCLRRARFGGNVNTSKRVRVKILGT